MKKVKIGNKWIGDRCSCFIVAEIGGAFRDLEEAKRLINSAKEIGVDAVKFQTLEAETITTKNNFLDLEITGKISQYEFFKNFEISKELQKDVVKYAKEIGVTIFSAPSHIKDLDLMKEMDLPVYKIGSDLACHIPLLKEIGKLGKPIIISTGMCTIEEVRDSVNAVLSTGNEQLILMHCISNYPSNIEEMNLNAILTMKNEFNIPVGFSDHNVGTFGILTAATMGANIVEKHFRDVNNVPGPDDMHSLIKEEFSDVIKKIRMLEKIQGNGKKEPTPSEKTNMKTNRVSIVSLKEIKKGEKITRELTDIRRPGNGIQPVHYEKILGKIAKQRILKDMPITWDCLE